MGVRIYGTPHTPTFGNWAFMHSEEVLHNYFSKIPKGLDILLSHGPVYGLNDTIMQYPERTSGRDPHIGSKSLREHMDRAKPTYVLVGHIHSGNHKIEKRFTDKTYHPDVEENYTLSINVSTMDEDYSVVYKPFQFILEK
jgi:Icc-related predicted phosphoesterase